MAETVTVDRVRELASLLPPSEQQELAASLGASLGLEGTGGGADAPDQRLARADAILHLCDEAAEGFEGYPDSAEDIRHMREERHRQVCRSDA